MLRTNMYGELWFIIHNAPVYSYRVNHALATQLCNAGWVRKNRENGSYRPTESGTRSLNRHLTECPNINTDEYIAE